MHDLLEEIDDLFSSRQKVTDETGCLGLVTRLLRDFAPRLVILADREGKLVAAEGDDTHIGPAAIRERAATLAAALADTSWRLLDPREAAPAPTGLALRLPPEADGGILGACLDAKNGDDLSAWRPVLEVCGVLLWQAIRGRRKNVMLDAQFRNLAAEHDTIKDSLEESIATAIEEHEKRMRVEQDHVSQLEAEVERRSCDLRQALAKAREANELKTQFVANMSHELRTPLHGILSFAGFGIKEHATGNPKDLLEYFEKIQQSGKTLLTLLNDLLELAKLEAGKMTYDFVTDQLHFRILQVADEFSSLVSERNITIEPQLSEFSDPVTFDAEKMKQVMRNLLSNAVKFSPPGGTIRITMDRRDTGVLIAVRDEGPGIPEAELELVFDKFVQSSKTKSGAGGTGLGLAICREIVAAHHGRIWAENASPRGAVFFVELPLASEPSSPGASAAADAPDPAPASG